MGTHDTVPSTIDEKSSSRSRENRTNYRDRYKFLVKILFDPLKGSQKGSLQRRRIKSILVNGTQT